MYIHSWPIINYRLVLWGHLDQNTQYQEMLAVLQRIIVYDIVFQRFPIRRVPRTVLRIEKELQLHSIPKIHACLHISGESKR